MQHVADLDGDPGAIDRRHRALERVCDQLREVDALAAELEAVAFDRGEIEEIGDQTLDVCGILRDALEAAPCPRSRLRPELVRQERVGGR